MPTDLAASPAQEVLLQHLAEVGAGDDLGRLSAAGKLTQGGAEQADAVCGQRSLPKLVDDAQRPASNRVLFIV